MSIFVGFALRLRLRRSHRLLNSDPSGLGGYIVLLNGRTMLRNQYAASNNEQRKPSFKFGTSDEFGSVVPRTKSNVAKTIIDPTQPPSDQTCCDGASVANFQTSTGATQIAVKWQICDMLSLSQLARNILQSEIGEPCMERPVISRTALTRGIHDRCN